VLSARWDEDALDLPSATAPGPEAARPTTWAVRRCTGFCRKKNALRFFSRGQGILAALGLVLGKLDAGH